MRGESASGDSRHDVLSHHMEHLRGPHRTPLGPEGLRSETVLQRVRHGARAQPWSGLSLNSIFRAETTWEGFQPVAPIGGPRATGSRGMQDAKRNPSNVQSTGTWVDRATRERASDDHRQKQGTDITARRQLKLERPDTGPAQGRGPLVQYRIGPAPQYIIPGQPDARPPVYPLTSDIANGRALSHRPSRICSLAQNNIPRQKVAGPPAAPHTPDNGIGRALSSQPSSVSFRPVAQDAETKDGPTCTYCYGVAEWANSLVRPCVCTLRVHVKC